MKIGDTYKVNSLGTTLEYQVVGFAENGMVVSELRVGVIDPPIEEVIAEVAKPVTVAKAAAPKKPAPKKPTTKKK